MPINVECKPIMHIISGKKVEVQEPIGDVICYACKEKLYPYDIIERTVIPLGSNASIVIYIYRYRHKNYKDECCKSKNCQHIYAVLPPYVVPFKRHVVETIQQAIDSGDPVDDTPPEPPPIDSSSVRRMRSWFRSLSERLLMHIHSIRERFGVPKGNSTPSLNELRKGPRWLAKLVREAANSGFSFSLTLPREASPA